MIPKRLIFIWLGSDIPDYGKFCIENFRKVNPDFEIMIVNEKDIEHSQNKDIIEFNYIFASKNNKYKYLLTTDFAKNNILTEIGRLMIYSDAFRMFLLNKYGGIYLDLDTFPVSQFDEELLSYENGFAINHHDNAYDIFFIGLNIGFIEKDKLLIEYPLLFSDLVHKIVYPQKFEKIFNYKSTKVKKKFYNMTLLIGDTIYPKYLLKEYYIDHFRHNNWKNK